MIESNQPEQPSELPKTIEFELTQLIDLSLTDAEKQLPLLDRTFERRDILKGFAATSFLAAVPAPLRAMTQKPNKTERKEQIENLSAEDQAFQTITDNAPILQQVGLQIDTQHPANPLTISPEFLHILEQTDISAEEKANALHAKVLEGLKELPNPENTTVSNETLAWSFVTTIAAIGTLADMTKRGRVGIRDYAIVGIAAHKAAVSAGEKGIAEFDANLKDTFGAMGLFAGITFISKLASLHPRDVQFHLKPELAEELAQEIRTTPSKVDQAIQIMLLANLISPFGSPQMTTAFLQPLLRAFATDENGILDKEMIGILEGNVANNLGLWRASLYPLATIASPFGGGMGPLKAIQTVKGDQVLQRVNLQMLPFQIGMNGPFALQVAHALHKMPHLLTPEHQNTSPRQLAAHLLHRSVTTPSNITKVRQMAEHLHIIPQHKEVWNQARDNSKKVGNHLEEGFIDLRNHLLQLPFAVNIVHMDEILGNIYGQLSHLDEVFVEGIAHIAGEDIRDIIFVLLLQSLAIPQISTVMEWTMDQVGKGVPEAGQEVIKYALIAGMSSSFDNYAAVNTAIRVEDVQMDKFKRAGLTSCKRSDGTYDKAKVQALLHQINHKRMHGLARSLIAGTMGGGILPPGNMANLPIAPLSEYGIQDAKQRERLLGRLWPIGATYLAVKALDVLGWYMSPEDPSDNDLRQLAG